ncbi:MAG: DUF4931 domain-containing protein [Clostridium sp.]
MKSSKYLCFKYNVGKEKHRKKKSDNKCPFCNISELEHILDQRGDMILVENKYLTLEDTFQTVLIETNNCEDTIETYSKDYMRSLIKFGVEKWLELENSGEYKSVVFYKNHGPLSGGSVHHAHMQIVGLKYVDYRENLDDDMFEGINIYSEGESQIIISTKPRACSTEYNIITTNNNYDFLADGIANIVKYILKHCNSFNLFFYQWKDSIICKVVPRYITSPYLIGYNIPQTSDRLDIIVDEIKNTYYK